MVNVSTAIAPVVSKSPIFAGTVRLVRNQVMNRWPPPRRSSSPFGSIVGHDESSKLASPAFGVMSYDVFHAGPAFGIAGASTIFTSMFFQRPLNAAIPSGVVRFTTYAAGIDGAMTGSGVAAEAGGACASATDAIVIDSAATAPHVTRTPTSRLRICPPE